MALIDDFNNFEENLNIQSAFNEIEKLDKKASEQETPMFSLALVNYEPIRSAGLKEMVIANKIICFALESKCYVLRLDLSKQDQNVTQILVTKREGDRIHKIFMDPTATHVIVSMESQDNYYFHSSWSKTKLLNKLKGVTVESVAWDKNNDNYYSTTKEILIGSNSGQIFEASFECRDGIFVDFKDRFKPIHLIGADPVTGLHFERFPDNENKYLVIATTPTQLYQFIGGPTFSAIFERYEVQQGVQDLPSDLPYSRLAVYSSTFEGISREFAWLVGVGIFRGELIFGAQNTFDRVTSNETLTSFPPSPSAVGKKSEKVVPLSIVITEFHWIVLYANKIQAINKLNEEVVFENILPDEIGQPLGLAKDVRRNSYWLYGSQKIMEIVITEEGRNIWALYLSKGLFEQAILFCQTGAQRDKVWTAQANHYFAQSSYKLAATYYGKTSLSFEEITLKFIRMNDRDALKTYLVQKLDNLSPKDVTQKTMICTWLVEIYLNKLNQLKDDNLMAIHDTWREEFKSFLKDRKECLNRSVTYKLISSHGRISELLAFARYVEDYELVVSHYIQKKLYGKALSTLHKYKVNEELFYKYSPVIFSKIPTETIKVWADIPNLNPRFLVPAFTRYDESLRKPGEPNHVILYLEYVIGRLKNVDPVIHNYLIKSYIDDNKDPELLAFLSREDQRYDKEYALRLCTNANKVKARLFIISSLGYYEDAVKLALSKECNFDLTAAKYNASKPQDKDLQKKLWIIIAQHVISSTGSIREAMDILTQTDLLKIEDILPYFPEFTLIDDFKDEICGALEEYNKRIDQLKREMDSATDTADLIRRDIKNLRNKYVFVEQNQKCSLCTYPVLSRAFYLFPCLHAYHVDCLTTEIMKFMEPAQRQRVMDLQNKIGKDVPQKSLIDSVQKQQENLISQVEQWKLELDDLIAYECYLCGDLMIHSISQPFIGNEDEEINSWKINLF